MGHGRIIRDALLRTMELGGRSLRFGADGIEIIDAFGRPHSITISGSPARVFPDQVRTFAVPGAFGFTPNEPDRDFGELGEWSLADDGQGTLVGRPKRPTPPCLEAVAAFDGSELARLRSLYLEDDIDIFVMCEGASRAETFARALAAERNLVRCGSRLHLAPSRRDRRIALDEMDAVEADPVIDPIPTLARPWSIRLVDHHSLIEELCADGSREPSGTRVFVSPSKGHFHHGAMMNRAAARVRPSVAIIIGLEDSKPIGRMRLSERLLERSSTTPHFDSPPWEAFIARREALRAVRPSAPRTWHQTTAAVARAFVERRAPRGYVSGRSIYFHGPIAFSMWDGNPIAAFVDLPRIGPVILMGRAPGVGGGKSQITSCAQDDIGQAASGRFDIVRLGDLDGILKLGAIKPSDAPRFFREHKNEVDYPSACAIDPAGLAEWFADELVERRAEMRAAEATVFPTHRKAAAYAALAGLARLRDRFAELTGIELPEIGKATRYMGLSHAERTRAERRADRLREERAERAAEAGEGEEARVAIGP